MKIISIKDAEKNRKELEISIDKASFDEAVTAAFRKKAPTIAVPGFRKGKAPRNIVEKMYGKGYFYEDALNNLVPKAYEEALKESELDVVSYPEYDIKSIDENGVVFTAKVYVKPEGTIKDYKGLEAEQTEVVVSDEQVNEEVERARKNNAREVEITDRAAKSGDKVNIDYDGYQDGKRFDGGKAEGQDLVLGSNTFIPGFEDQIAGHNVGDEFDVNVTFPKEYHEKTLAGKEAVFKCKLNAIKFDELPELDDEFAKDVSEFDTLEEYKNDVKAKLVKAEEDRQKSVVEGQLMTKLVDNFTCDVPEPMIDDEVEQSIKSYENNLYYQGIDLNTFLKYTKQTMDDLKKNFRPQSEKNVRIRLALEAVAAKEKIEVKPEDVEEEYKRIADAYKMDVEKVKELVTEKQITADVKVSKAMDFVRENAKIKVVTLEERKAEAEAKAKEAEKTAKTEKKTTAKKTTEKKTETAETETKAKTTTKKTTTKKTEKSE
jgi:trigger factor